MGHYPLKFDFFFVKNAIIWTNFFIQLLDICFVKKFTVRRNVLLICTCPSTCGKHKLGHFLFLRGWKKDGTSIDVIADGYDHRRYRPIHFVRYILHGFRAFLPVSYRKCYCSVKKGLVEDTKPVKLIFRLCDIKVWNLHIISSGCSLFFFLVVLHIYFFHFRFCL